MENKLYNKENILGIVAEYNPFHNGHKYQLEEAKKNAKADKVVVVMSGNFTQRGEPAILDKWTRTRMALENGVDLVLELPLYYACNGASQFAQGAIKTLKYLGCVSHISFGSEVGKLDTLQKVAEIYDNQDENFYKRVRELQKKGVSHRRALEIATVEIYGREFHTVFKSNDILASQYIYHSMKEKFDVEFVPIKRKGQNHLENSLGEQLEFQSATYIRKQLSDCKNLIENIDINTKLDELKVPDICKKILLENIDNLWLDDWYRINNLIRYMSLCQKKEDWLYRPSWETGMEGKFLNDIRIENVEQIMENLVSKRYTRSRVRKFILQVLMDIKKEDVPKPYVRVLGFNDKGREILHHIKDGKNKCKVPIITKVYKDMSLLDLDVKGTDFYNLIMKRDIYENSDFVKRPVII